MLINNDKFKQILKKKNLTKQSLIESLCISSRTIAKIAKGENISEKTIEKICEFLECSQFDICEVNEILHTLRKEKAENFSGGLYHYTQIKLTYNSNHIEGSALSEEQTRFIFETQTLGGDMSNVNIDDIVETNNHFRCIDYVIEHAEETLSEKTLKDLHALLKRGTADEQKYGVGVFKKLQNTVGGIETAPVDEVELQIKLLLDVYNRREIASFEDIVNFHYKFEKIHPFQDGNGRVGRLIAFKECLKNNIVPFYIDDKFKWEYYNGLAKWNEEKNYLLETCKLGQDLYKKILDYFSINYKN